MSGFVAIEFEEGLVEVLPQQRIEWLNETFLSTSSGIGHAVPFKSVIEMRQSKGLYAPHCKGSCSQKVDFHKINDTIYVQTHKWVFQLRQT